MAWFFQVNLLSAYFLSFLLVCILYTHMVLDHLFLHFQLCCTPLHLLWLHWCCLKTENFFCQWQSSYNIFLLNYCLFQLAHLLYNILNIFHYWWHMSLPYPNVISLVYVAQLFSLFHRILQVLEVILFFFLWLYDHNPFCIFYRISSQDKTVYWSTDTFYMFGFLLLLSLLAQHPLLLPVFF